MTKDAESTPETPQLPINARFHERYDGACGAAEAEVPIFVVLADALVVYADGPKRERIFTPPPFHTIKAAAHAPVAAFATTMHATGELDARTRSALLAIEGACQISEDTLAPLSADAVTDVRSALDLSLAYVRGVLATGQVSRTARDHFAAAAGRVVLRLTGHATELQLVSLHATVEDELGRMNQSARRALQVVVAGAHQARARSLGMQYFRKRFGESPETDRRVTYAEGVADADEAKALVGKKAIDRTIAAAFFGDPTRLQQDVLGDATETFLGQMELPPIG